MDIYLWLKFSYFSGTVCPLHLFDHIQLDYNLITTSLFKKNKNEIYITHYENVQHLLTLSFSGNIYYNILVC